MSKEIWENNLGSMEKWYPAFTEMLRERKKSEDEEVILEKSWDGELVFRMKKEDKLLYLNGKRNAKEAVRMWRERLGKIPKYTPVFLFGIGNGAYLKALVKDTDETVNIVVYEPSITIFLTLLEEIDLSEEIAGRPIAFVVEGINETEFEPVLHRVLVLENLDSMKEEVHPNYRQLYPKELLGKIKILEREASTMEMGHKTRILFRKNMAQNILNNMKYVCEGYNTKSLAEAVKKRDAAVLVAAGPSLNKNIAELKKAKNRIFILAVDTAIKPLMHAGIVPDAFITIDPDKPLSLIEVEGADQIPIIAPCSAHYTLLRHQKGKKIFFFDGHMLPYWMFQRNGKIFPKLSMGGSVACSAFSLLFKMGFRTIILVGQDLAYTDNRSHADGTFQEKMPEEDTKGMIMVKGNYQDKVPTLRNLKVYLDWFNDYIRECKNHQDIRVVNATEGGALIQGTEIMKLKEILTEFCREENNFTEQIEQMKPNFTGEEKQNIMEYFQSIVQQFEEIIKKARQLREAYQNLDNIGKLEKIEKRSCLKQLKKIQRDTKICEGKDVYQLIEETMQAANHIIRREFFFEEEDAKAEIREVARKGILYSELLEKCAGVLKELAVETLLPMDV